jgi:hypothetical protein
MSTIDETRAARSSDTSRAESREERNPTHDSVQEGLLFDNLEKASAEVDKHRAERSHRAE